MPRRYVPKPFNPKPFKAGSPVTWIHESFDGDVTVRTGIVWSEAPLQRSHGPISVWVSPDEPLPNDPYRLIIVTAASAGAERGYSSNKVNSAHGDAMRYAFNVAYYNRQQHALTNA
jgi:hypothetical protein